MLSAGHFKLKKTKSPQPHTYKLIGNSFKKGKGIRKKWENKQIHTLFLHKARWTTGIGVGRRCIFLNKDTRNKASKQMNQLKAHRAI